MNRVELHQPGVAVKACAFIPPAFLRHGIHPDGDDIHFVAESGERRDVHIDRGVAAPIALRQHTVDPDRGVRGNAVELDFQMLAVIGGIELEIFAIPTDSARAITFADAYLFIERLLHRPVVRQIDRLPRRVVKAG